MTLNELQQQAHQLEMIIEQASHTERMKLKPQVSRVIATLKAKGGTVPKKLVRIDRTLNEEAFEDMIDNLPI